MLEKSRLLGVFMIGCMTAGLAQPPKKSAPAKTSAPKGAEPKFQAIWEPVNVKEDVRLFSAYFVSPDEGWVAGGSNELNGGIILHTKNGGATWETQLGDPQSSDRAYRQLRFLNSNLGWAAQSTPGGDHKLLRTTDGQSWQQAGTVAQHRTDYIFTSADIGFVTYGKDILRTQDGGRHWQPVYNCRVKTEVNGLTRDVGCEFEKIVFVDPKTGFAISREMTRDSGFVFAKTNDGGASWQSSVILPGENGKEGGLWFTDERHGVLRVIDGKLFYTEDAGATWTGASGQADGKPEIQFVDSEVGWMVNYRTMSYTTDGGKHWVSRRIAFPASVDAFSFVRRDRGYAVGEHGMVYRYRIVPIDYTSKGMLSAPAMPAK